jgi:anthranilate phosphoribosyltransferase
MNEQAIRAALGHLARGGSLTEDQAMEAMAVVMEEGLSHTLMAAFLMGLRGKGETVDEIVGCARAIRARSAPFPGARPGLVDTCGTGGDGAGTFNISTTAAFVVAGAGVEVAKHGNRAVSSATGSADMLEALGVEVTMDGREASEALDTAGITFLFAPVYHAAMRHAAPVRRELGVRTIFNLLGPLCNPAGATAQVVGVFDGELVRPVAEALARLGARRAMVVHGADGLDELTVTGPSKVAEWNGATIKEWTVHPEELGLTLRKGAELRGGDARANAAIARGVLSVCAPGSETSGASGTPGRAPGGGSAAPSALAHPDAASDVVLLNAAAGLVVAERARDLREGLELARAAVGSGAALDRVEALVGFSGKVRQRRRAPRVEPAVPAMDTGWGR